MLKNAIEVIFVFRDHYHKLSLTLPEVITVFFYLVDWVIVGWTSDCVRGNLGWAISRADSRPVPGLG